MVISVNGQEYFVKWRHILPGHKDAPKEVKLNGKVYPFIGCTECGIYNSSKEQIAFGKAQTSPKDQFCYREGRKYSLKKALESQFNRQNEYAIRKAFWDIFNAPMNLKAIRKNVNSLQKRLEQLHRSHFLGIDLPKETLTNMLLDKVSS